MALSRAHLIGDPGLFDVFKRVARAGLGFVTGGPGGAARGFFSGGAPVLPPPGSVPVPASRRTIPIQDVPGVRGVLERALPGGATGRSVTIPGLPIATGTAMVRGGNPCLSGFHLNKTSYMTRGGFVEAFTKCVRNRRRNLSNGRANSRAMSRMIAWDKQTRKRVSALRKIARK